MAPLNTLSELLSEHKIFPSPSCVSITYWSYEMRTYKRFGTLLLSAIVLGLLPVGIAPATAASPHVTLCTAGNYLLLGSVITNGAGTRITSTVPGALVGAASPFELLALVGSQSGVTNESDYLAHTTAMINLGRSIDAVTTLAIAGKNLTTAELSTDRSGTNPLGTYGPGVYTAGNALNVIAGATITLDAAGDPDANFYFVAGRAFTLGAGVVINLVNGAKADNVYFVAGTFSGDMTIGASSKLYGNFLINGAATVGAGVVLTGRLLVKGAVTLGATSHIQGVAANTGCSGTTNGGGSPFPVPGVVPGTLPVNLAPLLLPNFIPGISIGTTPTGATPANNGTIAMYSPTGTAPSGTPINYITYSYVPTASSSSIVFSNPILKDGRTGETYIDFVEAKSKIGATFSGQFVSYTLVGALPSGLTFYPLSGYIAGLISKDAAVAVHNFAVLASSANYADQLQNYSIRVTSGIATTPNPTPTTTPTPTPNPTPTTIPGATGSSGTGLSILFTDTTLVDGRLGKSYSDYVKAKTFIGNTLSEQRVTYSLTGKLPLGLFFSSTTGYIAGAVSKSAVEGLYKLNVSAYSKGYPTQSFIYDLSVRTATPDTPVDPVTPVEPVTPAPAPLTPIFPDGPLFNSTEGMTLMSTLWFNSGKSTLTLASTLALDSIILSIRKSGYTHVVVNGFTDGAPGQSHATLSLARAYSVAQYLFTRNSSLKVDINGLGLAPASTGTTLRSQASRKAEIWVK
jgi:outer membrane protein OmpA-like peptidoglycan-associated protein